MRVVLLTGQGLEHRYVAQVLAAAFPDALQAIFVAEPTPVRARLRSWWRRYSIQQIMSRVAARLYRRRLGLDARRAATFARVLFEGAPPAGLPRPELHRLVPGHNHPACIAQLEAIAPDVIVVYGTGIIRGAVIRAARKGIVNLHTGLSPWYRGADTIFWAIHEAEPEKVGVTVHLVSEAVDAGEVLHTARPTVAADDDEDSLFAKGVIVGTDRLVEAVREIAEGRTRPIPQDLSLGREFRFIDRNARAERRVQRLLRDGLLRRTV